MRSSTILSLVGMIASGMLAWGPQGPQMPDETPKATILPFIREGKFGYMDLSGTLIAAPQFDGARNFADGLACVERDGHWGYIDTTGRVVIPPQFDWAYDLSNGLAYAGRGTEAGYIDRTGRFVWSSPTGSRSSAARSHPQGASERPRGVNLSQAGGPAGCLDEPQQGPSDRVAAGREGRVPEPVSCSPASGPGSRRVAEPEGAR